MIAPGVIRGLGAVVAWLPRGRALPCASWRSRHDGLRLLLWAFVPALLLFGALQGYGGVHAALHLAPLAGLALLGGWSSVPQRAQAIAVTLGLLTAAALGVHLADGVTESHFLFFVLVIGLSLYEDWLVFLLAVGYVVVHHGLASRLGLGEVYSHAGSSLFWAAVHGAFVLFAGALCVVTWRASEQTRAELQIAERQKLESQLREAQKLESLGLLAGGIAHDFNNLLQGVLGNAALVRDDLPPGSPLAPYVEQIELAGQRAASLTRQMLAYSGNGRLDTASVAITPLVREIVELTSPAIPKRATLELRLDEETPLTVRGDAGQLSQVVMNLLTNAAEALPDGVGTVVVRTGLDEPSSRAFVEVADTGCGMSAETRARMFDPFFTTKFTGRGLGLAAVSGIVRSHDGTIDVQSSVGIGTTFRVLIPLADAEQPVERDADQAPVAAEKRDGLILLVDDEPSVLEVACRILERDGYEVLATTSGSEAVQHMQAAGAGVVAAIVDMSMPGLNGIETMRAMRHAVPSLPVILSSGHTTEMLPGALSPGTRFIQKPYSAAELTSLVREVLAEAVLAA